MTRTRAADVPRGWMAGASCAREDLKDLPWITDTHQLDARDVIAMACVCAACPVRDACGLYAFEARVTGGFWAGHDRLPSANRRETPAPGLATQVLA